MFEQGLYLPVYSSISGALCNISLFQFTCFFPEEVSLANEILQKFLLTCPMTYGWPFGHSVKEKNDSH